MTGAARRRRVARALGAAAALVACGQPPQPSPARLFVDAPLPGFACAPDHAPRALDADATVDVWVGAGVSAADAEAATGRAAAFWRRYGVRVRVREVHATAMRAALLPPDGADDAAALRAALAPTRAFVTSLPDDAPPRIVLLDHLVEDPRAPRALGLEALHGLTLTPDAAGPVRDALDVARLPPIVLVDVHAPLALAHELGHLWGLGHGTDPLGLMAPEPAPCLPRLSDRELAIVAGRLGTEASGPPPG